MHPLWIQSYQWAKEPDALWYVRLPPAAPPLRWINWFCIWKRHQIPIFALEDCIWDPDTQGRSKQILKKSRKKIWSEIKGIVVDGGISHKYKASRIKQTSPLRAHFFILCFCSEDWEQEELLKYFFFITSWKVTCPASWNLESSWVGR